MPATFLEFALTFNASRSQFIHLSNSKLTEDADRKTAEGMERLKEAREFAKWSKQQREKQMPTLTEEQNQQLANYLRLIEDHGWNKSMKAMQNGDDPACEGCPVMNFAKNKAPSMK